MNKKFKIRDLTLLCTEQAYIATICSKLREMMPLLQTKYNIATLEIFGSYVRGEADENSDLDLLVSFREPPTLLKFIELENFLSNTLHVKVDLVMKSALKPKIGEKILSEAQDI